MASALLARDNSKILISSRSHLPGLSASVGLITDFSTDSIGRCISLQLNLLLRCSIVSPFVLLVFVSSGLIQDLVPSLDMTYSSFAALNAARDITNSSQYEHLCV